MTTPPYAKILVRLDGGAPLSGGITSATVGQSVQLSVENPSGLTQYRWEIYDYPPDFECPEGWEEASDGTYYSTDAVPAAFDLTHWGDYLFGLYGNESNVKARPAKLTDFDQTAIRVESPNGLVDLSFLEKQQFHRRGWPVGQKQNLRVLNEIAFGDLGAVLGNGADADNLEITSLGAPTADTSAARRQDTLHNGSAFVSWNESLRRIVVLGSEAHASAGYSLRTAANELRGNWEFNEAANRVRLYSEAAEAHIVGNWEVPSGSTLTVQAPAADGHAARRQDTLHNGSANLAWDEANRRLIARSPSSGSNFYNFVLANNSGSQLGGLSYRPDGGGTVRLWASGVTSGVIEGSWSTVSAFGVGAPAADGHAATKGYVDGVVSKQSHSVTGASWNDGSDTGTADLQVERVGNIVSLRVTVTADGGVGPSIAALAVLPSWAIPDVTLHNVSTIHTAANAMFIVEVTSAGAIALQKRNVNGGLSDSNWSVGEVRTLTVTYPVAAPSP